MKFFYPIFLFVACGISMNCPAQLNKAEFPQGSTQANSDDPNGAKKGALFIAPYYQFSYFQKLQLISQTNSYQLAEGASSYEYTSQEIAEYNDNYGTNYTNHLAGLRIGYQLREGLGVNLFLGVNHYYFNSWVSRENTQSVTAKYPALTFGGAANYLKALQPNLYMMVYSSITGSVASSVFTENNSGEEIVKSQLKSITWDVDLAAGCKLKKFLPYAGFGFTQQFIHPVTTERIATKDSNGNPFYNQTTFDSHVRGSALYGFAGFQYKISRLLTFYARSTFLNPIRITTGLNIALN